MTLSEKLQRGRELARERTVLDDHGLDRLTVPDFDPERHDTLPFHDCVVDWRRSGELVIQCPSGCRLGPVAFDDVEQAERIASEHAGWPVKARRPWCDRCRSEGFVAVDACRLRFERGSGGEGCCVPCPDCAGGDAVAVCQHTRSVA